MHELSIATSIVEMAEDEVRKSGTSKVNELILEIGDLSGVIIDALNFALEEAIKGTVLEETEIKIIQIEALAKCSACGFEYRTKDYWSACPNCNNSFSDIIKGKEMIIKSLIVE